MHNACDLIVLGAGSGGLATAFRAAHHGAKVVLLDPAPPGGTCVHRGCVPKKALWYAAQLARGQALAQAYGFRNTSGALDWEHFRQLRQRYVDNITQRYLQRLESAGVQRVARAGRLLDAGTVEDSDGTRWHAPHIVIATGARPRRLDLPGFALGMVSDDMFGLRELPGRIAVVGGGYVAVEFAGLLRALGSEVTVLARGRLLESFDAELVDALAERMQHEGIELIQPVGISGARRGRDGLVLEGDELATGGTYDAVLWAVGRVPNSDALNLAALGIVPTRDGHVPVDAQQNTCVPGVYAVGDVTDRKALTPVAVAAGRRLADRLFHGDAEARLDYANIPSVVFSEPPLATVGMTEAEARERHGDQVRVYRSCFTPMQLSLAGRQEQSLMKLVCMGADEQVVGIHAFGPGADEMLQGFAVALKLGVRKRDLDATVAIHPTSAEELVLMG
ncbi:glutathione-disulfide reductase [Dyella sp.]|jgi:glutathione reductase (NADPH)|uniref:glutathione-disulfide reductase n=1 Tax=Dyella sp. TaxID=1869338 RepID=UPI002D78BA4D|nr:glutathione-disulfide reductase [Dyella sp.]HET6432099.1 glutathione-disulfide reductase [Dyella sp.]